MRNIVYINTEKYGWERAHIVRDYTPNNKELRPVLNYYLVETCDSRRYIVGGDSEQLRQPERWKSAYMVGGRWNYDIICGEWRLELWNAADGGERFDLFVWHDTSALYDGAAAWAIYDCYTGEHNPHVDITEEEAFEWLDRQMTNWLALDK